MATCNILATSKATLTFSVHTPAAVPLTPWLAIVIASFSVRKGKATSTGPHGWGEENHYHVVIKESTAVQLTEFFSNGEIDFQNSVDIVKSAVEN